MSADAALQTAVRERLAGTSAVTALVPPASILDRHARPAPDPSIVLGEGQALPGDDLARRSQRIAMTMHLWKREPSLAGVKAIGGAVRSAIQNGPLALAGGYHCGDCRITDMRWLRDPDGETSHGVVTLEALVTELA